MNKKNIFISYCVEDIDIVRKIKRDIEALDHKIWIYPQAMNPGSDIIKTEKVGIENSDVVLFMTSAKSTRAQAPKKEINFAKALETKTGKKKTYFVRIDINAALENSTIQKSDLSHPETYTGEFCRLMLRIKNFSNCRLIYDLAEDTEYDNWFRVRVWVEELKTEHIKSVDYHLHQLIASDLNTSVSNRDKQKPFRHTFYNPTMKPSLRW